MFTFCIVLNYHKFYVHAYIGNCHNLFSFLAKFQFRHTNVRKYYFFYSKKTISFSNMLFWHFEKFIDPTSNTLSVSLARVFFFSNIQFSILCGRWVCLASWIRFRCLLFAFIRIGKIILLAIFMLHVFPVDFVCVCVCESVYDCVFLQLYRQFSFAWKFSWCTCQFLSC